jgi:hypothetical protein
MSRIYDRRSQVSHLILVGTGLLGIALFAPDAGQHFGAFFKIAATSSWRRPLEGAPAWCSLKIILLSIGLMLVVESLGTILVRLKHNQMGMAVFSTHVVSLLVFFIGEYYLFKALL